MSKFNSCPPTIILMDILFIFLFSTLLEKPPKIDIIPPDEPFEGGEIVLFGNTQQHYWYDRKTNNWRDLTEMGELYKSNLYITVDCNKQCTLVSTQPVKGEKQIAIIGTLYEQIAGLTFIACNTDASQCSNIRFTITPKGQIDRQKLVDDNPVFLNVRGIEKLFK